MSGRSGERSGDLVIAKNAALVRRPGHNGCLVGMALHGFRPEPRGHAECLVDGREPGRTGMAEPGVRRQSDRALWRTRQTPGWRSIADQLQNAATSAAANYRAAARARSRAEFVAKLGIVNEESDEAVYWLELMRDSNVGDRRQVGLLLPEAVELRAIFAASYRTARRNRSGSKS